MAGDVAGAVEAEKDEVVADAMPATSLALVEGVVNSEESEVTAARIRASRATMAAGVGEVWWSLDLARGRAAGEDMVE